MTMKTAFWVLIAAYYAVVAVRLVRAAIQRRRERRHEAMTAAERAAYARYWRWSY